MKIKLQKQLTYKCKNKRHHKNPIVPDQVRTQLGWNGGQDSESTAKGGKVIAELRNASNSEA